MCRILQKCSNPVLPLLLPTPPPPPLLALLQKLASPSACNSPSLPFPSPPPPSSPPPLNNSPLLLSLFPPGVTALLTSSSSSSSSSSFSHAASDDAFCTRGEGMKMEIIFAQHKRRRSTSTSNFLLRRRRRRQSRTCESQLQQKCMGGNLTHILSALTSSSPSCLGCCCWGRTLCCWLLFAWRGW